MRWCTFIFFITIRCINYFLAHVTWIFYLAFGCAYFQFWKSYDILWLWMHLLLCICIPKLRRDNIFLTMIRLIQRKRRQPEKGIRELFKGLWEDEKDKEVDEDQEVPQEDSKPRLPKEGRVLIHRGDGNGQSSSRLASAVSLGLFYLRLRVSFALLTGSIHLALLNSSQSNFVFFSPAITVLFKVSIVVDILSLWILFLWSLARQCQLCCRLGCCRYYLWVLLCLLVGVVTMEIPMQMATHMGMDDTWCTFDKERVWDAFAGDD